MKIVRNVEKNCDFVKVGKELITGYLPKSVQAEWLLADLSLSLPEIDFNYDLVVLGNVLNELTEEIRKKVIDFSIHHCRGVLVIVEPGTPYGFEVIKESARKLKFNKGFIVAPYIKNFPQINFSDWIHFSQKIKRPEFQRKVRNVQRKLDNKSQSKVLPASDWEEAKYSYIAISTFLPEIYPWGRVIEKPKLYKPFIELKILTEDGIVTEKVFKRDKRSYKFAKKLNWGDVISSKNFLRYNN